MEVNGVVSGITSGVQTQTTSSTEPSVEEVSQEQPQSSEIPEVIEQQEELPGVIRNLLEGHFKGVSDARLRINHFEALKAVEQEQLHALIENYEGLLEDIGQNLTELLSYTEDQTVPQETSTDIASASVEETAVPENVEDTVASDELTQEQEEIVGDASEKVNGLLSFENQSKDTLLTLATDLHSTLTELATSLESPVPSTINETSEVLVYDGEAETVSDDSTDGDNGEGETDTSPVDSPSAFEIFVNELNSVFLIELDELTQSLSEFEILPELSEPNGNGSAYEKFLALYNKLWGNDESNSESPILDITI